MRRFGIVSLCLFLAFVTSSTFGAEQDGRTLRKKEAIGESRKLLEEVLMARLTRELALEETEAILMVRHMTELRDRMISLRRERSEKMRSLRQAVRESKDENRIDVLMEEVLSVNQKTSDAKTDLLNFDDFELTTWQKARLLIFLNDFEADMRRLLNRAKERRAVGRKDRPTQGENRQNEKSPRSESEANSTVTPPNGPSASPN